VNHKNMAVSKLKSFSLYFFASIVTAVVGLSINPLMSIGLSHVDYAIIGYYSAFGSLLTPIVSFSLQSYYARNYYLLGSEARKSLFNNIVSVFSTMSIALFALFILGYGIYHKIFVTSIPFLPYAILSFSAMFISSYYNLYLLDLRMANKSKSYAAITIANSLATAILSILFVYIIHFGAMGRLVAILFTSVVFALYGVIISNTRFQWDWNIIKPALKFCMPITVSGILTFFFVGIDRPLLSELKDNYTMGLYNVGLQISAYLAIFGTVLLQTFDPDLYKYTSLHLHKKVFILVLGILLACSIPNLCFILFSKQIIGLLTAGRYIDASSFANILCVKNITTTFAYIMSGVLIGYGYPKYEMINRIIGSIVAFILYYILIFWGAAWGQSLSWLAMGIISCCALMYLKRYVYGTQN